MKIDSNAEHSKNKAPWFAKYSLLLILCIAFALLGCDSGSDPDDEDEGIVGTGILLQGTVQDTLLANGSVIETYSSDGKIDVIAINSDRSSIQMSWPVNPLGCCALKLLLKDQFTVLLIAMEQEI